jgi:outer membrane lipoprotein-sorting protein
MRKLKISVLTIVLFLYTGIFYANAQDANTILKKMDDVMYSPKDMTGKTKIILIDKAGKQKTREANIIQKGNDKRIFRFTAPASQAGIAVLSLPNDVMYLYLPAFGKERRISSSVKNQNFAGTDFSYDDMESKPYSEKYTPKLIKTEGDVYVLELSPKSPKSAYSRLIVKVHKTNYYPAYMEYYDKGNKKIKEATYKFKKIGNYWNAEEIEMTDLKKNHKTKMLMSDVKYDTGLTDDEFTVRKLKQ